MPKNSASQLLFSQIFNAKAREHSNTKSEKFLDSTNFVLVLCANKAK